jgi:hypothetical protein
MTGLHARLGWPIWLGRTLIEATVLGAGWLLGGDVGFGTLAFALLIGPLCGVTLPLLAGRKAAGRNTPVAAGAALEVADAAATAATGPAAGPVSRSTPSPLSPPPSRPASSRAPA